MVGETGEEADRMADVKSACNASKGETFLRDDFLASGIFLGGPLRAMKWLVTFGWMETGAEVLCSLDTGASHPCVWSMQPM